MLIDNEKLRTSSRITFILGHSSLVLHIQDNVGIPESKCSRFEGNVGFVNMWSYQLQEDEVNISISLKSCLSSFKDGFYSDYLFDK